LSSPNQKLDMMLPNPDVYASFDWPVGKDELIRDSIVSHPLIVLSNTAPVLGIVILAVPF
jgi:predicted acyltransferase (DUF342 family)